MASHNDNPQAGQGRPLPKKEQDIFKNVVKHYETKQYKKAIKQADLILRRFPNHGETLAMKGLTLNYMSKREEAHALVKQGLTNDMRSHVCWHVYGLLHRSDRNYNEAIKAYKQALRIDAENLQILRDLSMLQIQMRDLNGFAITRHRLLTIKSNAKVNWLAFALAKHLTGDLRGAVNVIDIYLGTLTEESPELDRGFESSELAMYRNSILADIPDNYKEALDHLETCKDLVVDRTSWLMTKAGYCLKLKDYPKAKQTAMEIFHRGVTEDYRVHSLYMCALLELESTIYDEAIKLPGTRTLATMMPLSKEQRQTLLKAYQDDLLKDFKASPAVQRIPLALLEGDDLHDMLDKYCRRGLTKGVPSLCSELLSYVLLEKDGRYIQAEDPMDIKNHPFFNKVVELVDSYVSCLLAESKFAPNDENEESPSTILWAWYLRAGLHESVGEFTQGIEVLDKCLEHTPTAVDVYELKARLLKKAGSLKKAVECLDTGRDLDRQDRYINNQTTKYMLQAGMDAEALKRISLFTRHEGNPEQNLYDMQCSWYELELARCLAKKEEWGRCLKKYSAVAKHFEDFHEDQFDFHAYCVRKVTLRAYVQVLRFEDKLWGADYFYQAASGLIGIYIHLFDNPSITKEDEEPDYSKMTAAERKKAKAIARKKKKAAEKKEADRKKKEAEQVANAAENGNKKKRPGRAPVVDDDPDGKELLKKDPLEEARKLSAKLTTYLPDKIEVWMLQYDVSIRRKKSLMALQALFKARSIDASNSELFSRVVDFLLKVPTFEGQPEAVLQVIEASTPTLLGGKSLSDFVSFAAENIRSDPSTNLLMRVAAAEALVKTKVSPASEAALLIVDGGLTARGVTVDNCRRALKALKAFDVTDLSAKWITNVQERFPLLTDFS